ncbi:hypothetical protein FKZ61_016405 [Litorilinea aerophila]|uniref:Redoxin domain-containing protein n=1 Tax=Litorilinea aerophila TaxID=1204385 RepID=A0A540VCH6_9CHLR|nr:hypothetical protein [Litorilinea aerophila]MCC9077684.1 hypothetical protein [Litorilinea aerophila]
MTLRSGTQIPNWPFTSPTGETVAMEDFRHRCNLVVALLGAADQPTVAPMLDALAARAGDLAFEDATALAVVQGSAGTAAALAGRVPAEAADRLLVVADTAGLLQDEPPTLYVVDRYGQIYAVQPLPTGPVDAETAAHAVEEAVGWLRFVNLQCPECGVPEWPTA